MPRTALVVLIITILAATVTIATWRHITDVKAERQAAADAADAVTVVADTLRAQLSAPEAQGSSAAEDPGTTGGSSKGLTTETKATARDSGQPVLEDSGAGVVVLAQYDTPIQPATVQGRRNHLAGYAVMPLKLDSTLLPLKPTHGGISVSGPDRQVLSLPSSGPSSALSHTAAISPDWAAGWTVTIWTNSPRTPVTAWLMALILLFAGGAAAGWLAIRAAEFWRSQEELSGLQRTSAAIAELASLAQNSLDLGEVLPAVTTELSSSLGLLGVSVIAPTLLGERTIFVWGTPAEGGTPIRGIQEVSAGETPLMVLSRGGRMVAKLRVTAGRDLDRHDVRTLFAAGDLLTSVLANTEAFSQQVELVRRMRSVDELKTVFLATASHELRTPVVAIAGYANLLNTEWDTLTPEQARSFAERIDSSSQRLSRLVEDILDFSRLETGSGLGASPIVFDLGETVQELLDEQPDLAPDHVIVCEQTPGLRVNGSPQAIERVLLNLVGNAAKYSDAGSRIRVLVREADGRAELVVEDDGPGIAPADRAHVFSPFYRGHGNEVVRTRGAGLGLAIVAEFAASMAGQISVTESESGGASFVVSYPIASSGTSPAPGATHVQT